MDFRALIVFILAVLVSTPSYALFISGELTTDDALGIDDTYGNFYYDIYYVSVDTPMKIEVFMNPAGPFAPYLAYWDGNFSATPDWNTPPPLGDAGIGNLGMIYMAFDAMPGTYYEIMATTYNYNPTNLGIYNMHIVNPARDDMGITVATSPIANVPEPSGLLLLGLGLLGLGLITRQPPAFKS